MRTINLTLTTEGLPALWEKGGGCRDHGEAQIIATAEGGWKRALYARQKVEFANQEHALFVVQPGDLVIQARHHRGEFEIDVMRIVRIDIESKEATLEQVYRFSEGRWDKLLSDGVWQAARTAMRKAECFNCWHPHYALAPTPELSSIE